METGGFFINPAHVSAMGTVTSAANFTVFVIGAEEPFVLRYANSDEANAARETLKQAINARS
jgi:hypothetical protein